jgi:CRISPR-associated protein Cst2
MTIHVYGAIVTAYGTAANNRGENSGNVSTLQKLMWNGRQHTTVSAESIRFALRRRLAESGEPCNRTYNEDTRMNDWKEPEFSGWSEDSQSVVFIDDDLLGFMAAEAAKADGNDAPAEADATDAPADAKGAKGAKKAAKPRKKGTITARRAVLEVTRSVSLTPWSGDSVFNVASPRATASAAKKDRADPVPYGVEMHATRYQYAFAMTPDRLRITLNKDVKDLGKLKAQRAAKAVRGLCALGEVAGNHGRFLFDFSPESVVFRLSHDPAPRILYAFDGNREGVPAVPELIRKVKAGDIKASELVIGGAVVATLTEGDRAALQGASIYDGVLAACDAVCARLEAGT